ncbi:MAG: transposase, partial [Burkholderiales bacterium]
AIYRFTSTEDGKVIHKYWSSACTKCSIKPQCTKGVVRKITRWEHEAVLERMQERLNRTPEASKIRRRTVEHTFGTLKAWMGATHFTMKTLPHVRTEMSLYVLAYNMKRMMQIMGVRNLIGAMRAA